MSAAASNNPAAPAMPDSSRLPHSAYPTLLVGEPATVTGANSGIAKAIASGLAQPHAIAQAAVWLASDAAD
jgi:hypothetical protein